MPKLNVVSAQVASQGPVDTRSAQASDYGSDALAAGAEGLDKFASFVTKTQENTEPASVRKTMVEGSYEWSQNLVDRAKGAPEGAQDFTSNVSTDLDKWLTTARENYKTPAALEAFDQRAAALRGETLRSAMDYQSKENARFAVANIGKTVSTINNRTSNDPAYYANGAAQTDLNAEVQALRDRGLDDKVVIQQAEIWQKALDKSAADGRIAAATTSASAKAFVAELEDKNSPWMAKLPDDYASMLKVARAHVITTMASEEVQRNKLETEASQKTATQLTMLAMLASGPPSSERTAAIAQGRAIQEEYYKKPDPKTASNMRMLDVVLDTAEAKDGKIAAKALSMETRWTAVALNAKVSEARTADELAVLQQSLNDLQKQTDTGDATGIRPTEWASINSNIMRRQAALARGEEKVTAAQTKEHNAKVKEASVLTYTDMANRVSSATSLDELAALTEGMSANLNVSPTQLLSLQDRARGVQKTLSKVALKAIADQEKLKAKQAGRTAEVEADELDRISSREDLTEEQVVRIQARADELRDQWEATGEGLSSSQHRTISVRLDKQVIESNREKARVGRVASIMTGASTDTLVPGNTEDMKAVDAMYKILAPQFEQQDADAPGARESGAVGFVSKVRVVPTVLKDQINGMLNSEVPDNVIAGARLVKSLEDVSPQVSAQLGSTEAISLGRQVLEYNKNGMNPQEAMSRALDLRRVNQADRDARLAALKGDKGLFVTEKVAEALTSAIDDDLIGDGADERDIPVTMLAEYRSLVELEYQRTGDLGVSKNSAVAALRGTWGARYVDGQPKLMKQPPHLHYQFGNRTPQATSEAIMEQLIFDIKNNALVDGEITPDRIRIEAHPTKKYEGKPMYKVILLPQEAYSLYAQPHIVGGEDYAWRPDYATSKAKKLDDEKLAKAKATARKRAAVTKAWTTQMYPWSTPHEQGAPQ